jgi:hypothetical protein
LNREIEFSHGKKDGKRLRRKLYQRLLRQAKRAGELLDAYFAPLPAALAALNLRPSRKEMATRALERLRADLDALAKVRAACQDRVLCDKSVPMAEKILSLSDPDVGFICKGQREPVVGYKPQLARSGNGFIVGLHLPKGNAPDAKQLVPMVEDVIAHTHVVPKVVSVDDGYASALNVATLKQERNIEVVSINGAKGRALTASADWESDVYAEARDKRSAVESLMFTLKHGYHFGEVARRGLVAVYAELLEKALAYNLCVTARRCRAARIAAA